ncbi:hypothetical protein AB0L14_00325 [Streptomyces sp. NPDC052727]|uniref:hypothetical protein n=1 Tax=Streptomyces sp. NPDC052727 TaxID=3154854 RepID=UPI0034301A87
MHNNLIYLTDGRGKVDASKLSDAEWAPLVVDNRDSVRRRLVKCAWCWDEDRVTHWMKTYSRNGGGRVVSHQPGESADHPYQALESDEHKAYCDRVERVGVAEGYTAQRESRADDGRTRSDVLLVGARYLSYEMQHSPFKPGYGARERTRRSLAAKRDAVAWHTDSSVIADGARVAMLRSNQARRPQIENPRYEIRILGGYRRVLVWDCTSREGHRCPLGRYAGCGATHVDSQPSAISLDDFIRQAPAGLVQPVWPLDRLGFWTTAKDYQIWVEHFGEGRRSNGSGAAGRWRHSERQGNGHSRRTAAKNHAAVVPWQRDDESQVLTDVLNGLINLERSAMEEFAKLADLRGEAYDAQWKAWRTAAGAFQAALTECATHGDVDMSRPELEQAVKRAVRHSETEG